MDSILSFDTTYRTRKEALLGPLTAHVRSAYTEEEVAALRIAEMDSESLVRHTGRGFVGWEVLETVLGNMLECVAPGAHNARSPRQPSPSLVQALASIADQLYTIIAQSLMAAGENVGVAERALESAFALLFALPELKQRALWNRFAALRDPAVWDAYLLSHCSLDANRLLGIDFAAELDEAIHQRDMGHYRRFMHELGCDASVDYQLRLVMSSYPGWRVLLYHDVAHALTQEGGISGPAELGRVPVPFLPRAIAELGGRYYQADIHPETRIGDANFLDHTHRGITTGQTGVIGSGCHLLPCTMGGLSEKVQRRHPRLGDHVFIGTDVGLFGSVSIGDGSMIGPNTEIHGKVVIGRNCRVGASAFVGTIKTGSGIPGCIRLGDGVRVGAGTILENGSQLDLIIPDHAEVPARSHVTNDGFGRPRYARG